MESIYDNYSSKFNRYIDNNLLNLCLRPHTNKHCALFSLTTIYNYLFCSNIIPREILNKIGWEEYMLEEGKIGNRSIINGFYKLTKKKIKPQIILSNIEINENVIDLDNYWEKIKKYILSKNDALLYHEHGHYTLICGFIEEPYITCENIDNNFKNCNFLEKNKWLIISEHRSKNNKDIDNGIFRQINWKNIINELIKYKIASIILFSKT